jgi:hypothetical protein
LHPTRLRSRCARPRGVRSAAGASAPARAAGRSAALRRARGADRDGGSGAGRRHPWGPDARHRTRLPLRPDRPAHDGPPPLDRARRDGGHRGDARGRPHLRGREQPVRRRRRRAGPRMAARRRRARTAGSGGSGRGRRGRRTRGARRERALPRARGGRGRRGADGSGAAPARPRRAPGTGPPRDRAPT